jgi:hypothetical protein
VADGKRRRRAVAAGVPATLLLAFANPTPAMALRQPDYPSWDDVEQARHDEAAAQATVEQIEGILIRLEAEAAELNRIALELGEEYALAASALDAASAKLDRLKDQADAAQERAEESEQHVAVIVAQLARNGGGDVTLGLLLGSADDADTLLARLGTADRLTASSAALLDRAIYDKKTAQALAKTPARPNASAGASPTTPRRSSISPRSPRATLKRKPRPSEPTSIGCTRSSRP